MQDLATVLTYLMTEKGISSAELARKTDVSQPVIYRLMTGATENPQIQTVKPIADFFGVELDQLLGFTPLHQVSTLNKDSIQRLSNRIITIQTVGSAIMEVLPHLIEGYEKSVRARLITAEVSIDILPLLLINAANLLKSINEIQQMLLQNPEHAEKITD